MSIARTIRRICFPTFLVAIAITVVSGCYGVWSEAASPVLWKLAGSALIVSMAMALVLSVTRVTFDSPDRS